MKYIWVIFDPPVQKKNSTKIRNMAKERNNSQSLQHKIRLLLRVFFFFFFKNTLARFRLGKKIWEKTDFFS